MLYAQCPPNLPCTLHLANAAAYFPTRLFHGYQAAYPCTNDAPFVSSTWRATQIKLHALAAAPCPRLISCVMASLTRSETIFGVYRIAFAFTDNSIYHRPGVSHESQCILLRLCVYTRSVCTRIGRDPGQRRCMFPWCRPKSHTRAPLTFLMSSSDIAQESPLIFPKSSFDILPHEPL